MDNVQIALGSMGWVGNPELSTVENSVVLCRVQLFEGRNLATVITPGRAQGRKILAQLLGPAFDIPSADSRVLVAIPHELEGCDGAAVLLGRISLVPAGYDGSRAIIEAQGRPIDVISNDIRLGDTSALYAAIASLVDNRIANIVTWLNTHIHTGVTTGPGSSGTPATPKTGEASVAATKVKIT